MKRVEGKRRIVHMTYKALQHNKSVVESWKYLHTVKLKITIFVWPY